MILRVVSPKATIEESPYIAVDTDRRGAGGAGVGGEGSAGGQPQPQTARDDQVPTTPLPPNRAHASGRLPPVVTQRAGHRPTAQQLQQQQQRQRQRQRQQRHAGEVFLVVRQNSNPHLQRVSLNLGTSQRRQKRSLEEQEKEQEQIKRALHPNRQSLLPSLVDAGDATSKAGTLPSKDASSGSGSNISYTTTTTTETFPAYDWRKRGLHREVTRTTVVKTVGTGDHKKTTTTTTTTTRYVKDTSQKRRSTEGELGKRVRIRSENNNTASTADPYPYAKLGQSPQSVELTEETQSDTDSSFSGLTVGLKAPNTSVERSAFDQVALVKSASSELPDLEEASSTSSSSSYGSTDSENTAVETFRFLASCGRNPASVRGYCPVPFPSSQLATLSVEEVGSHSLESSDSESQDRRKKRKKNNAGEMWRRGRARIDVNNPDNGDSMDTSTTAVDSTTIAVDGEPMSNRPEASRASDPSRPPKVVKTVDNTINTSLLLQPGGKTRRAVSLSSLSERSPIKDPSPILRNSGLERKRRQAPVRTLSLLGRGDTKRVSFSTDTHFDQAIRAGFAALSTAGKTFANKTARITSKQPEPRSPPPPQPGRIPPKVKPIVRRLSSSEKVSLFRQRPDLDPYAAYALWKPSRATKSFSEGLIFRSSMSGSVDKSLSSTSTSQGSSLASSYISSGSRTDSKSSSPHPIMTTSSTDSETDVEAEFISIKWVRRLRNLAKSNAIAAASSSPSASSGSGSARVTVRAEQRQDKYGASRENSQRERRQQLSPPPQQLEMSSVETASTTSSPLTIEGSNYDVIPKDLVPEASDENRDPPPSSSIRDSIAPLQESLLHRITCCAAFHQ